MEFKKKMHIRRILAFSYLILGIILILTVFANKSDNQFFSAYGFTLILLGILRLLRHKKITQDDKSLRKQELEESDERSRMIAERSKSWAFTLSIIIGGILVIVMNLLGYQEEALPFAWFVCAMMALYWLCWIIIRRKY